MVIHLAWMLLPLRQANRQDKFINITWLRIPTNWPSSCADSWLFSKRCGGGAGLGLNPGLTTRRTNHSATLSPGSEHRKLTFILSNLDGGSSSVFKVQPILKYLSSSVCCYFLYRNNHCHLSYCSLRSSGFSPTIVGMFAYCCSGSPKGVVTSFCDSSSEKVQNFVHH